jgi:predicted DNA-binding protein with PD1-like motif
MRYQKTPTGYMLRMERGEEIHAALTRFMQERGIEGGSVVGVGAVTDITLGYFDLETKEYTRTLYDGEYELINLTGNLSTVDGESLLHAHVVISGADMAAIAGHLFAATIAVTGEFWITVAETKFERTLDQATGLKLLDLPERI